MQKMQLSSKISLHHNHLTYYLGSPSEHLKNHTPGCQLEITEKQENSTSHLSSSPIPLPLLRLGCYTSGVPERWWWCSICSSLFSQTSLCLKKSHSKWNKIYSLGKHHSGHNTPLQTPQHTALHPPLQNSLTKAKRQEKVSPLCTTKCYYLKRDEIWLGAF